MIIANQLKEKNRAEYLLYMWQVEDLIRSLQCDEDRIATEYIATFHIDEKTHQEMTQWYANLCEMMRSEGKMEKGHLQINKNTLQDLAELNAQLLHSPKFPYYREMYYKILPYIVELRSKNKAEGKENTKGEIETCFDLLYGVMLLRIQKKELSQATQQAVKDVTQFLGQLSDYYIKNKKEPISFED